MTNGVNYAKEFNLVPGMALTAAQMDALTSDIVWLVEQTVTLPDGTTQHVLAPVVYLAQAHANDLLPTGALIAADDVEIHAAGSVTNSGVIKGGTQTVISATDILNRGGMIGSSSANGTTVVSATNDITNASGRITGNRVAVLAGHDIVNTTLTDAAGVTSTAGDSRVQQTLVGAQGSIDSTGDMLIGAGHDLTVHGATIAAGGNGQIAAANNLLVDAVQSNTSQSVTKNADHHWEENTTLNQTSGISAGGSLAMQSGNDMTFKGARVSAGQDMAVVAGGNLTATTVTDSLKFDNVATDDRDKRIEHNYDEQAVGTSFAAGGSATLAAISTDKTKGNVMLTGSSLSADTGAANILATGNVSLNEAREEHDSYTYVHSERGSIVNKTTANDSVDIKSNDAVGSLVSGNTVGIAAGKDITIQGSDVVATHDMAMAALGNVNITAAQSQYHDVEQHEVKKSGISGSGGIGVSIGSSEQKASYDASAVTESQSRSTIGSVQGNVSISAGKDLHICGSDVIAGRAADDVAGVGGNIALKGQNVMIDPGLDNARSHEHEEARASGMTVGITGTPLHTARNVKDDASSGTTPQRAQRVGAELAASAMDTPSVTMTISHSSSSNTTDVSSVTNSGSAIRGAGDVSVMATGGGVRDASGHALDGDITVTGSTITAGGTATLDANRDVTLQASTDRLLQDTQSSSSSSSLQIASPSLGDAARWVGGGANNSGVSASPYNASSGHSNSNGASTTQTASVVTGNNVSITSRTGDVNVIGSGVAGTQGVDLLASQGAINVLAGLETSTNHRDESHHQFGDLGSNGTGTVMHQGSALAGTNVTIVATGSGAKDAAGYAADGDINSRGTTITSKNATMAAARDVNLLSAQEASQQSGSNSSSNASIGVGLGIGGTQNGFTLELAASGTKGHANGNGVTHQSTQVNVGETLTITSGRDTNLIGAEAAGRTVDVSVGRDLTIRSEQDTNQYNSQQSGAGFQASLCVPPFCYGQTVSGSASASKANIDSNFESVNRQSGLYAGDGGFNVNVQGHTQLDAGAIASTAAAERNALSMGTFGYSDLQNHADSTGTSVNFGGSTAMDSGASTHPGIAGLAPTGFGAAGTSSSASGTTYAVVGPATITVRDDASTGRDSTAGLSRDAAHANGSVYDKFDAQKMADDIAVQQAAVQVGMTVAGAVAGRLEENNSTMWDDRGVGREALHAGMAAAAAALGGGNVAGAIGGTVAGDLASGAVSDAMGGGAGSTLMGNIAAGAAGAAAGAAIGSRAAR
ncbi:hemagglutinin repeat-containing protein [Caballeronia sp. LZ025]|nr:hemagglutinin repeat-containing protein [Caballeronia sp. LZ025]MDR5734767.1 hemagglutinin repeat-containing protein [Caballeronia sp. LZ025]